MMTAFTISGPESLRVSARGRCSFYVDNCAWLICRPTSNSRHSALLEGCRDIEDTSLLGLNLMMISYGRLRSNILRKRRGSSQILQMDHF